MDRKGRTREKKHTHPASSSHRKKNLNVAEREVGADDYLTKPSRKKKKKKNKKKFD